MMDRIFVSLLLVCSFVYADNKTKGIFDCLTGPCVTVPGVGKLQGSTKASQFTGRDVHHFLHIPYGASTEGENRFAPPKPAAPLNDGQDAYDASYLTYITGWWNHVCPQPGPGITGEENPVVNQFRAEHPEMAKALPTGPMLGTEDCLHLAVFTPQLPAADHDPRLPVMVYIHGGSFMLGGYIGAGPGKLLERDMVLVAIQYRVGPLGFMCLPDDELAGNMGLMDQQLALQWVHQHIANFGGDPDRITIMGESAGSASVTYHMLSQDSMQYFSQAIAESGSALSSWAFDATPEKHATEIAGNYLNCPTDNTQTMISCLKNEKSAMDIVLGHKDYYKLEREEARMGFGGSVPCAQTHGTQKFITKHPKEVLMDHINDPNHIPIKSIFGANKHEGSFVLGMIYNSFIAPNNVTSDSYFLRYEFTEAMLDSMGIKDYTGVLYELISYRYFEDDDLGVWDLMIDGMVNLVGTFFIKASSYEFMKFNQLSGAENYFYSFEYYGDHSLWNFLFPGDQPPIPRGVTHGDELLYLFSTGVFDFQDNDWEMARIMTNLWANFVIYGDPASPEAPVDKVAAWPHWEDMDKHYLKLDLTPSLRTDYLVTWENPDANEP